VAQPFSALYGAGVISAEPLPARVGPRNPGAASFLRPACSHPQWHLSIARYLQLRCQACGLPLALTLVPSNGWVSAAASRGRAGLSLGPALLTQALIVLAPGGERRVEPTSSAGGLSQRRGAFWWMSRLCSQSSG
jgi:hypothetical protein